MPTHESRIEAWGAWAPGSYYSRCLICGETFIGDKRARWCGDCAANKRIEQMKIEIEVLRDYGNKDCTAMADERLKELFGG